MRSNSALKKQRRGSRTKAVLPVRVKGRDSSGAPFEELAHTLDVAPAGLRLGAVRRVLNLQDEVTVVYRQRKMDCRVVWIKKLKGTSEFQVGLQALVQDGDALWLSAMDGKVQAAAAPGPAPEPAASPAPGLV